MEGIASQVSSCILNPITLMLLFPNGDMLCSHSHPFGARTSIYPYVRRHHICPHAHLRAGAARRPTRPRAGRHATRRARACAVRPAGRLTSSDPPTRERRGRRRSRPAAPAGRVRSCRRRRGRVISPLGGAPAVLSSATWTAPSGESKNSSFPRSVGIWMEQLGGRGWGAAY